MPHIEIRQVQAAELYETAIPLMFYAFRESPVEPTPDQGKNWVERYSLELTTFVLFEDGEPVATAAHVPMTQQVRGKVIPMSGILGVASYPQARRKGYVWQVMEHTFAYLNEQQFPVSTLYPFRESFYGRLGYVGFPHMRIVRLNPATLAPILKQNIPGDVRRTTFQQGSQVFFDFLEQVQPNIHGMSLAPRSFEQRMEERNPPWIALAEHNGELIGAMEYRISGFAGKMTIPRFFYRNSHGKYLLLDWIARHVDQVTEVDIHLGGADMLENWAVDIDPKVFGPYAAEQGRVPMGRVINVMGLNGLPVGEGEFTATITDDQCAWNNGSFRFVSDQGSLMVEPVETGACTLTIQALAAWLYNGTNPDDFQWRGWGNPSPDIQQTMRRMLPPATPHLVAKF